MSTDRSVPNLIFVQLIHGALRADAARLVTATAALSPADRGARLVGVSAYYDKYREQLISHHTHEDTIFFPALAARSVDIAESHCDELEAQHHELDGVLQEASQGFATMADPARDFAADQAATVAALTTMAEHLNAHLDLEEETAIPLIASSIPVAEYKPIEARVRKETPKHEAAFMIGWARTRRPSSARCGSSTRRPSASRTC
jgi:iron-sulfur cluster repair protein YtfE (RIC family)